MRENERPASTLEADAVALLREGVPAAVQLLGRAPPPWRTYLARLVARHGASVLEGRPPLRLSTIHAAKGREADTVVLLTDVTRQTLAGRERDPDAENRVEYVAVTRARRQLVIVEPTSRRSMDL